MSVLTVISRKIAGLLFGVLSIFKRLLCFLNLRRRRRNSGAILPMTADHISSGVQQSVPSNDASQVELESWDSWGADDNQTSSTNHISSSKQHGYQNNHLHRNKKPEPEPEPDVDFFEDMQPRIKKPKKILIRKKEDNYSPHNGNISSRLAIASEVPLTSGSELETWDDTGVSAWAEEAEEDLSWQAEATLKDNRRLEREQRQMEQHRKKMEKQMGKMAPAQRGQLSAVKLS